MAQNAFKNDQMKLAPHGSVFNKLVLDSQGMIDEALSELAQDNPLALKLVQRVLHTIKGNFSYFDAGEIAHLCHELEGRLDSKDILVSELHAIRLLIQKLGTGTVNVLPRANDYGKVYSEMVREIGEDLGKKAVFESTGLDLNIPPTLFYEFVHFILNSMVHGIESPAERKAMGKDPVGKISFDFQVINNSLRMRLEDDGRGVTWRKIPSCDSMKEALDKIKSGGVSTQQISEHSGRGVGVSSLCAAVEKLGGSVCMSSSENGGFIIEAHLFYSSH